MIEFRSMTAAERARIAGAHRSVLPTGRAFPEASESAERMAARMVDIAALTGACTDADLIEAGFTPDDLARDGGIARQLAYGVSERRVA